MRIRQMANHAPNHGKRHTCRPLADCPASRMSLAVMFALVILLTAILLSGCSGKTGRPYIDFSSTNPTESTGYGQFDPDISKNPLRIAVCPTLSQHNTIDAFRAISGYISRKLGRDAVLLEKKSYIEINVLLANGGADLAFLANGAYNSYDSIGDIEPLVMQVRFGVPYYHAYIIVPADSTVETLQGLRGKTFAFTDPLSFSGYLVPVHMLRQIDETPESLFSNYIFTYSHEKALLAVANKVVDGAAIGSHVYSESLEKQDGLADQVKIIAISEKSGTGPVVVRKSLGEDIIAQLKDIFLSMDQEPELESALKDLLVDRYVEPIEELYDFPRSIIAELDKR
ncbi:MAG: phosphate/phosphite/phosphonate ABC transporter substrate-binding protein [Bacillota bacterium]|nr:phosphate/phosphite/phosphonate ABC transporter substrate-binding protein [Bacillota bacterium]